MGVYKQLDIDRRNKMSTLKVTRDGLETCMQQLDEALLEADSHIADMPEYSLGLRLEVKYVIGRLDGMREAIEHLLEEE